MIARSNDWETIAVENLGLAHKISTFYLTPKQRVKDSDVYSVACIALIKAAKEYEPECGKFSTYAWKVMENGIKDYLRSPQAKKRNLLFSNDWEEELVAPPTREDLTPLLEHILRDHPGESEADRFNKRLLQRVYLGEESVFQVSEDLKISREAVYQRLRRAIRLVQDANPELKNEF